PEAFLAISPSLSLSAFAHEPQLLGGLCERSGRGASPIRGSGPRISLVRVISRVESTPQNEGTIISAQESEPCGITTGAGPSMVEPRQQAASCRGFLFSPRQVAAQQLDQASVRPGKLRLELRARLRAHLAVLALEDARVRV